MKNQINIDLKIPVSVYKENGAFVAYSHVLDLATSADTHEEVQEQFNEAVGILLESLIEKGTLEEVLQDLGWKKKGLNYRPPVLISQEMQQVKFVG